MYVVFKKIISNLEKICNFNIFDENPGKYVYERDKFNNFLFYPTNFAFITEVILLALSIRNCFLFSSSFKSSKHPL